jgi:hypothetical protein
MNNAFSGMMAAPVFGIITTPENFVKTQMQLDNVQNERVGTKTVQTKQLQSCSKGHEAQRRGRFSSSLQCVRTLVSSHGVSILYTGHVINTVREAAFVGTYFFCYEGYKEEFRRLFNFVLSSGNVDKGHSSSFSTSVAVPMAGGFAGASAWAITFPLDCVRAGMQGQPILSSSSQSTAQFQKQGSLKIFKDLLQTKGFTGLYAGVTPSIVRAFLVSGSRFSAYEGALWLFRTSQLK